MLNPNRSQNDQANNSEYTPESWREHIQHVLNDNQSLQTWDGHTDIRMDELQTILDLPEVKEHLNKSMLEFGCGNGLAAVFYSKFFRSIIATDLANEDHKNHAIGLGRARNMLKEFQVTNVQLEAGSGEDLKFSNNSIDFVFSHFVLEHIPNKTKCLNECYRVLISGGHVAMAVPAFWSTLFYPVAFYVEFAQRFFKRISAKIGDSHNSGDYPISIDNDRQASGAVVQDWRSFRKAYPHFPMPEPHGSYQSYFDELHKQRIRNWVMLFEQAGFTEIKVTPLCILPRSLMLTFFGSYGLRIFRNLKWLDNRLRKFKFLSGFSQYICVSAKKP